MLLVQGDSRCCGRCWCGEAGVDVSKEVGFLRLLSSILSRERAVDEAGTVGRGDAATLDSRAAGGGVLVAPSIVELVLDCEAFRSIAAPAADHGLELQGFLLGRARSRSSRRSSGAARSSSMLLVQGDRM